LKKTSTTTIKY